jgi:hypothetical protein
VRAAGREFPTNGDPPDASVEKLGQLFNTLERFSPVASVEELPELFNKQEISDQAKSVAPEGAGGLLAGQPSAFRFPTSALPEEGLPEPAPLVRRGRKSVLTQRMQEQLCLLLSVGLSRRQAASYLDIDQSTISHAAGRDEGFAHSLKRAEDLAAVQPMMALIGASRKNWRAAAWLMAHKQKYPAALSDDEKGEQLAEKLADARHNVQYTRELTLIREAAREAEEARLHAKDLARRQAERAERFPLRKKRVKEA